MGGDFFFELFGFALCLDILLRFSKNLSKKDSLRSSIICFYVFEILALKGGWRDAVFAIGCVGLGFGIGFFGWKSLPVAWRIFITNKLRRKK